MSNIYTSYGLMVNRHELMAVDPATGAFIHSRKKIKFVGQPCFVPLYEDYPHKDKPGSFRIYCDLYLGFAEKWDCPDGYVRTLVSYANWLKQVFDTPIAAVLTEISLNGPQYKWVEEDDGGYEEIRGAQPAKRSVALEVHWQPDMPADKLFTILNSVRYASFEFTSKGRYYREPREYEKFYDISPREFMGEVFSTGYDHTGHMAFSDSPFPYGLAARNRSGSDFMPKPGREFGFCLHDFTGEVLATRKWGNETFARSCACRSNISGQDEFVPYYRQWKAKQPQQEGRNQDGNL